MYLYLGSTAWRSTSLGAVQQSIVYQTRSPIGQKIEQAFPLVLFVLFLCSLIPRAGRQWDPLERPGAPECSRPPARPVQAPPLLRYKSADRSASPQRAVVAGDESATPRRTSPARRPPTPAPCPVPESCAKFLPGAPRGPCALQSHASAVRLPEPSRHRSLFPQSPVPAGRIRPANWWSAPALPRIHRAPVLATALELPADSDQCHRATRLPRGQCSSAPRQS